MKFNLWLTAFSALVFAPYAYAAPCGSYFNKLDVCAEIQWLVGPSLREANSFDLSFDSSAGAFLPRSVSVDLWMPGHGHGSSPVVIEMAKDDHVVHVSEGYFVMPGLWQIRITIEKDGETQTQSIEVSL